MGLRSLVSEVENNVNNSIRRALKQVTGKLESTFLLPILKNTATTQAQITWMVPNDMFAPSSSEEIQDSQSTVVSGVQVFLQQCSVAMEKETPECKLQGTSRSSELEIQKVSPQETWEDQFPHSGVSDEAAISEQSPVEQEDEDDEVSK